DGDVGEVTQVLAVRVEEAVLAVGRVEVPAGRLEGRVAASGGVDVEAVGPFGQPAELGADEDTVARGGEGGRAGVLPLRVDEGDARGLSARRRVLLPPAAEAGGEGGGD